MTLTPERLADLRAMATNMMMEPSHRTMNEAGDAIDELLDALDAARKELEEARGLIADIKPLVHAALASARNEFLGSDGDVVNLDAELFRAAMPFEGNDPRHRIAALLARAAKESTP